MRKIAKIFLTSLFLLIFINLLVIMFKTNTSGQLTIFQFIFGDFKIYKTATERFSKNQNYYQDGFFYLPSFFLLWFLFIDLIIYLILLFIGIILCFIILNKIEENPLVPIYFSFFLMFVSFLAGNIEILVFLLFLICLYYKESNYIIPILAFICFKPYSIFLIPFFLYHSNQRIKFTILFALFLGLFNIYFLLNLNDINVFLNYGFSGGVYELYSLFVRPILVYYVYILIK